MQQKQSKLAITTPGRGMLNITREVATLLSGSTISEGMLHLFVQHTSCSLLIQENADPDVRHDLETFFRRLVPEGMEWIVHRTEGPDDMPAHIRTALTQTSISIPVSGGRPALGTWQGLYLFEHRARPHRRQVLFHIIGE